MSKLFSNPRRLIRQNSTVAIGACATYLIPDGPTQISNEVRRLQLGSRTQALVLT